MHDQVGMGVRDGCQHIEKNAQACLDFQSVFIAVLIDVCSVNVFEDKIRLSPRRYSRIHKLRDMKVRKLPQNSAFAFESGGSSSPSEGKIQEFDRDLAFKAPIASLCEPHTSHPATSDLRYESVCVNRIARNRRRG